MSVKKLMFPPGVRQGEAGRQACPDFKQPQPLDPTRGVLIGGPGVLEGTGRYADRPGSRPGVQV